MLETKQIDGEDALNICREMMDTHTSEIEQNLIINIFSELFNCSQDTLINYIYKKGQRLCVLNNTIL